MTKFIKLTGFLGEPVAFQVEQINAVHQHDVDKITVVGMINGFSTKVKEKVDQVLAAISNA